METVKSRLKLFLKSEGITEREFAKNIGASDAYVSAISGDIGGKFLTVIMEKYPNLNTRWLMNGDEQMYINKDDGSLNINSQNAMSADKIEENNLLIAELRKQLADKDAAIDWCKSIIDKLVK